MACDSWIQTTIGEQATLQRGIDITKAEQRHGKVPVISSGGVSSYHDTAAVNGPGVVLGRKGVVGSVFFVEEDYWPHDTSLWVKDFHGNFPRFVYYFFKSIAPQIAQMDVGSANPTLNRNHVHPTQITWPPLAEQKAIAAMLGALDDKIELNRRMNATLEAIARALFRSWFIDFDPVRARLDGNAPSGIDLHIAMLFPNSFQESEIGHIPQGWTIQPIGKIVECVGGGTPSTTESKYWDGGIYNWTTPKDFSSLDAPILLNTDRKLTDAGIAKISSRLLPMGTLLMSSRAPVGYLAIAAIPVAINQGLIAMKCEERVSNVFMLNWCQANMAEIESRATGTTFAEISKQNFRPISVVLPPKELIDTFTARVAPIYAQITTNLQQSTTLAIIRDTLLPELLNGKITLALPGQTRE
jgi:type I restriction enzyme S subunit